MPYNAEKALLKGLINAADEWADEDMPLEVVSLAQDAGVPGEVITDATERSDVDFSKYQ